MTHTEDWETYNGSSGDSLRRVCIGETSHQMAGMQTVQRIKRQNCGNNVHVHHNLIFGSRDQIGSSFAVENGEAEGSMSYSRRTMYPGHHGLTGESTHDRYLLPAEAGSSSSSGFPPHNGSLLSSVSDRETQYSSGSNRLGDYTSSLYAQPCSGSRSACKRKSSMDDVIGSVGSLPFRPVFERRERDCYWFTEEASSSRGDAAIPALSSELVSTPRIPVPDTSSYSSVVSQSWRARPLHHSHVGSNRYYSGQINGSQEIYQAPFLVNSRESPDALRSSVWMSRGVPENEHMIPLAQNAHEISPFIQSSLSSAAVRWCGNGSVSGESRMHHLNVHRDLDASISMGAQARNFPNGALLWMGVPYWMRNTFEPSSRGFPTFPHRELTPQGSHQALVRPAYSSHFFSTHSPATPQISHTGLNAQGGLLPYHATSRAAMGSMISGSQTAHGNTYPSVRLLNRSVGTPLFRGPTESIGASPLDNYYGMPSQGVDTLLAHRGSGQPFPSQETFDHALLYNGFDIQDHHIGLQPDVDNMSYEELLALEERIGNVNTGLSEENISKCLKRSKHSSYDATASGPSEESEIKCSICQEEYMEGDELGQLNCSHSYHTGCIKQWLLLKNQCPICKATALSLP